MDEATFWRRAAESAANEPYYTLAADAYDGTGGFAAPLDEIVHCDTGTAQPNLPLTKSRTYVLRHPQETTEKYLWRVRNATYANFVRAALDTLVGFLFSTPPDRTWPDGSDWPEWAADVDGVGTSLDDHLRAVALRLMLSGTIVSSVDRPAEWYETAAEARDAGATTYVASLLPETLFDWRATSRGVLTAGKIVDEVSEGSIADESVPSEANQQDATLGIPGATVATPTTWARCRVWQGGACTTWRQDTKGTVPTQVGEPIALPEKVGIPLIVMGLDATIGGGFLGTTIFRQVCDEGLNLYRLMSLLFEALHAQTFAILCRPRKEGTDPGPIVIGTDNALNFDKDGAAPSFIAPPSSVVEALFRAINDSIGRIYELLGLDAIRGQTGNESGTARQWRFNPLNRRLSAVTKRMVAYERRLLTLRALWENKDPVATLKGYSVSWPDNFDARDVERQMKLALDAQAVGIGRTAMAAVRKGVRDAVVDLKPDAREESDREIDGIADVQAERSMFEEEQAGDGDGADDAAVKPDATVVTDDTNRLLTASTDVAAVVTVNEARVKMGLAALTMPNGKRDPDGDLTVEDFRTKREALRAAQQAQVAGGKATAEKALGGSVSV